MAARHTDVRGGQRRIDRCPVHGVAKVRSAEHDIPGRVCPTCEREVGR